MIHLISFSGGMGSFAEAKSCVDKYGKDNVHTLFSDTLIEDFDLYRFMAECVEFLGCKHTVITEGRNPFEVFIDVKFMGNSRIDPCSKILKRDFLDKWITTKYKPEEVEIHLGIDLTEMHRLDRLKTRKEPYVYRSTLIEDGIIVYKDYSEQFGIKPPRLYSFGLGHNNCGGFCVKAGGGHFAKLLEGDRDQYIKFENMEQEVYDKVPKAKPFLRMISKGKMAYITLYHLRMSLEGDKMQLSLEDSLDFGGCGCAI